MKSTKKSTVDTIVNRKEAILEASLNIIAKKGFHAAPMSQISLKSGVGIGTMYHYFKSKTHLINALFRYTNLKIYMTITEGCDPGAPVKEQFFYLSKKLFQFFTDHPEASSFFLQYIESPYGLKDRIKIYNSKSYQQKKTVIHAFYTIFDKAREQFLAKDLPNFILFTLSFNSLIHFYGDIQVGLFKPEDSLIDKTIDAIWDTITR